MGNQSGKERSDPVTKQDTSSDNTSRKLEECFYKLLKSNGVPDERSVGLHVFKHLFPVSEIFGSLLFNYWQRHFEGQSPNESMSKEQFIQFSSYILNLASFPDQMEFYFEVFSGGKGSLTVDDFAAIANCCMSIELEKFSSARKHDLNENAVLKSMERSLFKNDESVSKSDFNYWIGRHCPRLMHGVHPYVSSVLYDCTKIEDGAMSLAEVFQQVQEEKFLLTLTVLWALNTFIPSSYTAYVDSQSSGMSILRSHSLADVLSQGGWQMLYNSNAQGLSLNRFEHHVMSYAAATLTFIQFEDYLYCVGSDSEWIEKIERYGGSDCFLLQIFPEYRVMQAGAGMIYLNIQDRKLPKGLYIGKDSRSTLLQIDSDFTKVKHYGIEIPLKRIEVWGCGCYSTYEAQLEQRKWEHKEAEKHKNRKLTIEDWKDSPDRQLLEMGGIQTEHAER